MTDRAILKASGQILVLADHTKFGRAATVRLAPLESIHTIVNRRTNTAGFPGGDPGARPEGCF